MTAKATLTIITLLISLSPWLFETAATPSDRVFTGINRWSGDYFTYLSYVELGRRGELGARLLATTIPQKPVLAHLPHTLGGFIFGHLLGLNSVISYHLTRSFFGLIFVVLTFVFFYKLTKSKIVSLLSFLFTFYISGFPKIDSLIPFRLSRYFDWLQEQNIIGRATGPIHYTAGFIFFMLTVIWFFSSEKNWLKKTLILGLLINLTLLANPFAFLVLGTSFGLYLLIKVIMEAKMSILNVASGFLEIITAFLLSLPLFLYNQHFLSQEPWGRLGVAPKYYIVSHPPLPFWDTIMSIGPIFFLGLLEIIIILMSALEGENVRFLRLGMPRQRRGGPTGVKKRDIEPSLFVFLISWLIIQFFLFFFGDYLKIDPLRSFNGLYYLPLALFSALFVYSIAPKFKYWVVIILLLFLITFPNYFLSYKQQLFAFTDFKNFSLFTYPTKKQVDAFKYLEKNTPVASGVLALYEASSLVIGFSGNSSEVNMEQNLKIPFYAKTISENNAYKFLQDNHFQYVYLGYQEKSVDAGIEKYPFLRKIFENEEVKIYKVL